MENNKTSAKPRMLFITNNGNCDKREKFDDTQFRFIVKMRYGNPLMTQDAYKQTNPEPSKAYYAHFGMSMSDL